MSNFKKYIFALILTLILGFPLSSKSGQSVMQRGDQVIQTGQTVQDVVVADGNLVVKGQVQGSVFLVNGDAVLEGSALVNGNITILGGSLTVSENAVVNGEISIISGQAQIEEGAKTKSEASVIEELSSLDRQKLAVVSKYILFDRLTPPPNFDSALLDKIDLSSTGLRKIRAGKTILFDLFDLGRLPLRHEQVSEASDVIFHKHDIWAKLILVKFNSTQTAEAFWDEIVKRYENKVTYSVKNSLGEGAHWFFRCRGATYTLWRNQNTLTAVMVRHDDDDPEAKEWDELEQTRDEMIARFIGLFAPADKLLSQQGPE